MGLFSRKSAEPSQGDIERALAVLDLERGRTSALNDRLEQTVRRMESAVVLLEHFHAQIDSNKLSPDNDHSELPDTGFSDFEDLMYPVPAEASATTKAVE